MSYYEKFGFVERSRIQVRAPWRRLACGGLPSAENPRHTGAQGVFIYRAVTAADKVVLIPKGAVIEGSCRRIVQEIPRSQRGEEAHSGPGRCS